MDVRKAADLIKKSNYTVVLSGAGISTPSGIPDFRSDIESLWQKHDPMEVASLTAFRHHPEKFYAWLRPLMGTMVNAAPNAAHTALALLEKAGFLHAVITQNIDGLHQSAGAKNVIEVHGSIKSLTCISCYQRYLVGQFITAYIDEGIMPRCNHCRHVLKPDVILYEEQLPIEAWMAADKAAKDAELMIVVGSSLVVTPVAALPVTALNQGAKLIIINQSSTYVDIRAELVFHQDVAEIIPRIVHEVLSE